jgi:hypothetical protein
VLISLTLRPIFDRALLEHGAQVTKKISFHIIFQLLESVSQMHSKPAVIVVPGITDQKMNKITR